MADSQEAPEAKKRKTEMTTTTKLWGYWRSSCTYRVRIALNLKKVKVEEMGIVNLLKGENKDFEENPMKQVPLLRIDGVKLTQSVSIIEYLEETRSDQGIPLLPKDPKDRAYVRKLVEIINSGIQPIQNMGILKAIQELGGDKMKWGREAIEKGFTAYETELLNVPDRKDTDFSYGAQITMADVFLIPQIYNAKRFSVDLSKFPTILNVEANLLKDPCFAQAHDLAKPAAQKDAPKEQK